LLRRIMLTGVAPAWVKCGASRTAQVQKGVA
jgi:hypothetical protein